MSLKIKDGIDLEVLREYGFKTGKEWSDAGERCLEGIGHAYQHEWYYKFLMDADEDNTKIAYVSNDYDIPRVQISVITDINVGNRGESSLFKTLEECEQKCKEINQGESSITF